jgi:hypothetical protein
MTKARGPQGVRARRGSPVAGTRALFHAPATPSSHQPLVSQGIAPRQPYGFAAFRQQAAPSLGVHSLRLDFRWHAPITGSSRPLVGLLRSFHESGCLGHALGFVDQAVCMPAEKARSALRQEQLRDPTRRIVWAMKPVASPTPEVRRSHRNIHVIVNRLPLRAVEVLGQMVEPKPALVAAKVEFDVQVECSGRVDILDAATHTGAHSERLEQGDVQFKDVPKCLQRWLRAAPRDAFADQEILDSLPERHLHGNRNARQHLPAQNAQ